MTRLQSQQVNEITACPFSRHFLFALHHTDSSPSARTRSIYKARDGTRFADTGITNIWRPVGYPHLILSGFWPRCADSRVFAIFIDAQAAASCLPPEILGHKWLCEFKKNSHFSIPKEKKTKKKTKANFARPAVMHSKGGIIEPSSQTSGRQKGQEKRPFLLRVAVPSSTSSFRMLARHTLRP